MIASSPWTSIVISLNTDQDSSVHAPALVLSVCVLGDPFLAWASVSNSIKWGLDKIRFQLATWYNNFLKTLFPLTRGTLSLVKNTESSCLPNACRKTKLFQKRRCKDTEHTFSWDLKKTIYLRHCFLLKGCRFSGLRWVTKLYWKSILRKIVSYFSFVLLVVGLPWE